MKMQGPTTQRAARGDAQRGMGLSEWRNDRCEEHREIEEKEGAYQRNQLILIE